MFVEQGTNVGTEYSWNWELVSILLPQSHLPTGTVFSLLSVTMGRPLSFLFDWPVMENPEMNS